jgi:hypothetical protein
MLWTTVQCKLGPQTDWNINMTTRKYSHHAPISKIKVNMCTSKLYLTRIVLTLPAGISRKAKVPRDKRVSWKTSPGHRTSLDLTGPPPDLTGLSPDPNSNSKPWS